MIGGVDRVYEIGRTFRNEGLDSTHAAEFSMLEAYQAYGDYNTMAELTRTLVLESARAVERTVIPARDGSYIDLEEALASGEPVRAGLRAARRGGRRHDLARDPDQVRRPPRRGAPAALERRGGRA